MADLDEEVAAGALWLDLRDRWRLFALRHRLPAGAGLLDDVRGLNWHELFRGSVFRPRPPVFLGPDHLERLDARDRGEIMEAHGPAGAVDFFIFMLQVHETIHAHQTGEPLLNEVVQAACWIRFLDEERLWLHQRNSRTGEELPRESELVRGHPDLFSQAVAADLDTARLADENLSAGAYHLLCLWANAFDRHAVRYSQYLSGVAQILANGHDERWLRSQASNVTRALRASHASNGA